MQRAARPQGTNGESAHPRLRPIPGAIVVPIDLIERDPDQPRWDWTSDDARAHLDELVRNIQKKGVLEPLLVRTHPTKPGHFIVIAGGRRLVAAKRAGQEELPVIVRDGDGDADRLILQISENGQRQKMAPMDEARAYRKLMQMLDIPSALQLAEVLDVSDQHVRDRLRVLDDAVLAEGVDRKQIAPAVAREIKKLDPALGEPLRERVRQGERLTLRDVAQARTSTAAPGDRASERHTTGAAPEGASPDGAEEGARERPYRGVWDDLYGGLAHNRASPDGDSPATEDETAGGITALNRLMPDDQAVAHFETALSRLDPDAFETVLAYAIERAWTCLGLWDTWRRHRSATLSQTRGPETGNQRVRRPVEKA